MDVYFEKEALELLDDLGYGAFSQCSVARIDVPHSTVRMANESSGYMVLTIAKGTRDNLTTPQYLRVTDKHPCVKITLNVNGFYVRDLAGMAAVDVFNVDPSVRGHASVGGILEKDPYVYEISEEGNVFLMEDVYYDPETGHVIFRTDHVGVFAVFYDHITNFLPIWLALMIFLAIIIACLLVWQSYRRYGDARSESFRRPRRELTFAESLTVVRHDIYCRGKCGSRRCSRRCTGMLGNEDTEKRNVMVAD